MRFIKEIKSAPFYIWILLSLGTLGIIIQFIQKIYNNHNLIILFIGHLLPGIAVIELTIYWFKKNKKIKNKTFKFLVKFRKFIYGFFIIFGIIVSVNLLYSGDYYNEILFEKAIKNQDTGACLEYYKKDEFILGTRCLSKMALIKDDVSICRKAPIQIFVESCYYQLAKDKKDESICRSLRTDQSSIDICIAVVAVKKLDNSLCAEIEASGLEEGCIEAIRIIQQEEDITLCDNLTLLENECYQGLVLNKNEPAICGKIESSFLMQNCYMETAINNKDTGLCEKLDKNLINTCKILVENI